MLIKSDLAPLPCPGRFRLEGGAEVGAREAFEALVRGVRVDPADDATLELLADRVEGRDKVRAQMFRRASRGAEVVLPASEPEAPAAEEPATTQERKNPGDDAARLDRSMAQLQKLIEDAGDNVEALRSLADRVGARLGRRTSPASIRDTIFAAASKAAAEGRLPLSGE